MLGTSNLGTWNGHWIHNAKPTWNLHMIASDSAKYIKILRWKAAWYQKIGGPNSLWQVQPCNFLKCLWLTCRSQNSPPARCGSLDFKKGAAPSPSCLCLPLRLLLLLLLLPPSLPSTPISFPFLLVCSSCSLSWLWVSFVASHFASSGGSCAPLNPNSILRALEAAGHAWARTLSRAPDVAGHT